jgi:hypothetical protein
MQSVERQRDAQMIFVGDREKSRARSNAALLGRRQIGLEGK